MLCISNIKWHRVLSPSMLSARCLPPSVRHHGCPPTSGEAQDHQKEVQEMHLAPVRRMCQNEACLAGTQRSQHLGVGKTQGQGSDAHNRIWGQEEQTHAACQLQEASGPQQELEVLLMYRGYLTVLGHSQHFLQELRSHPSWKRQQWLAIRVTNTNARLHSDVNGQIGTHACSICAQTVPFCEGRTWREQGKGGPKQCQDF